MNNSHAMYLTLDIQKQAAPILRDIDLVRFLWHNFNFLLDRLKTNLKGNLDEFILVVEGFHQHTRFIDKEEAEKVLKKTRFVIAAMDALDERLENSDYMNDGALREKFKYALKTLYRLESLLHMQCTLDVPVEQTPDHIRQGLAGLSNSAIAHGIAAV